MSEQQATTEKKQKKTQLTPEQKRTKLEAEIARKKQQLAALAKKDRARATHDKILIGALVFALAAKGRPMLDQLLEIAKQHKITMAEKDETRLKEISTELEKNKKSEPPEPETPKPEPERPEAPKEKAKKAEETEKEKQAHQIVETLKARKPTIIQGSTGSTQGMTIEEPDEFKDA